MPIFEENIHFKLPGLGSAEKDTPGSFRADTPLYKVNGKKKKKQKQYQNLANVLNVDTARDTIIGPSSSHTMASNRGTMFAKSQATNNSKGLNYIDSLPNSGEVRGVRRGNNTEYYTVHKKK